MECLKCKAEMIEADLKGNGIGMRVYLSTKRKGIFESEHLSQVTCYVCTECGYMELQADDPKNLVLE